MCSRLMPPLSTIRLRSFPPTDVPAGPAGLIAGGKRTGQKTGIGLAQRNLFAHGMFRLSPSCSTLSVSWRNCGSIRREGKDARRNLSQHAFDIRSGEVVAHVEQAATIFPGHLIGEAVAEIESRRVYTLAPLLVRL